MEKEHSMSNWIELFFHIWVGVKDEGEGRNGVQVGGDRTNYWWLLATDTNRMKCGY